jgi:hypothetical protein
VPLQVSALPIQLPNVAGSDKRRFRDRNFMRFTVALPNGSNLKNFYALPSNPEIKINFFSNVRGRATPCNESSNSVLNPFLFQVVQH